MAAVAFRPAGPADANLVGLISAAAYIPAYRPLIGVAPRPATEPYDRWIASDGVWLAIVDGAPCGVLVLDRRLDHVLVYSVAVLPAYQGRGLGRALLAFAVERAALASVPELRLYTNSRMERNLRLYRRCGFVPVGERPHPHRPGETVIDMVRPVP